MFLIFLVLIVIVAFLLIVVIMVQNPQGGGLSSSFGGGGQQVGGVKKTSDFLDKSTWGLATLLLVLILISNVTIFGEGSASESKVINDTDVQNIVPKQDIAPQSKAPATQDDTQQDN